MSEREASIKLTLDDGQFVAAAGKAGDAAAKGAKKAEQSWKAFGAGVEKATSKLKDFAGDLKGHLGLASGLLGGLTFTSAIKGALELDAKFKQIAFNVSRVTGASVKSATVQQTIERAATQTGRRTAEMADVFADLFQATGDLAFTSNMLDSIGVAATATGTDVGTLAGLADQLHTKFGVAADEMGDLFASMHALEQGGNSMAEVAGVVGQLGAELQHAGMTGARGVKFLLGALAATEDPLGDIGKQTKGIKQILMSLGDVNQIKGLAKALHIDPKKLLNEKDLIGRLKRILAMGPKGVQALQASMSEGEERKALKVMFLDPFEAALKRAQDAGLKGKAATDAALEELEGHIEDMGTTASKGADLVAEANKRRQDPEKRLEEALDRLQRSFSDPKILDAIEELSKHLPALAEGFGKLAKFVVKNPWLSGTAVVAGKAGMGFLEGAIGDIMRQAADAAKGGGGGGGGGGKRKGKKGAGDLLGAAGSLADAVDSGLDEGGKTGVPKLAKAIQAATQAAFIAAAAAAAYEVGKELIDNTFEGKADAQTELAVAGANAAGGGSLEKQKADAKALREALARAKEESGGFVSGVLDVLSRVPATFDPTNPIGSAAIMAGTWNSGPQSLATTEQQQIDEMEALLKEKEARIAQLEGGGGATPAGAAPAGKDANGRDIGKATADALRAGAPVRVEVVNQPSPQGAPTPAGPGGSRGVKPPAAQAPGGGY